MKKYVEPKSPEEALKRLRSALNYICRGKIADYKPEAVKLLAYLEKGLISLEEFKNKRELYDIANKPIEELPKDPNG